MSFFKSQSLTHPVTGKNYPLVILHVALEHSITNSIDYLIRSDHHNTSPTLTEPSTAIFYSISSRAGKIGLNQIDLGNHMIKNAVALLKKDLPSLTTFSTLSPVPGFVNWLKTTEIDDPTDKAIINNLIKTVHTENFNTEEALVEIENEMDMLKNYCIKYLYHAKRRGNALDSVANFHLKNGACIYRLNKLADKSQQGLRNSFGFMVNYKYDMPSIEKNQLEYHMEQKINVLQPFENDL